MENSNSLINLFKSVATLDLPDVTRSIASFLSSDEQAFQRLFMARKEHSQVCLEALFTNPDCNNLSLIRHKLMHWIRNPKLMLENKHHKQRLLKILIERIKKLGHQSRDVKCLAATCLAYISIPLESSVLIRELFSISKTYPNGLTIPKLAADCISWLKDTSDTKRLEIYLEEFALFKKLEPRESLGILPHFETGYSSYFKNDSSVFIALNNLNRRYICHLFKSYTLHEIELIKLAYIKLLLPLFNKLTIRDLTDANDNEALDIIVRVLNTVQADSFIDCPIIKTINETFCNVIYSLLEKSNSKERIIKILCTVTEMLQKGFSFLSEKLNFIYERAIENEKMYTILACVRFFLKEEQHNLRNTVLVRACYEQIKKIVERYNEISYYKSNGTLDVLSELLTADSCLAEEIFNLFSLILNLNKFDFLLVSNSVDNIIFRLLQIDSKFAKQCLQLLTGLPENINYLFKHDYGFLTIPRLLQSDASLAEEIYLMMEKFIREISKNDYGTYFSSALQMLYAIDINYSIRVEKILNTSKSHNHFYLSLFLDSIPTLIKAKPESMDKYYLFVEKCLLDRLDQYSDSGISYDLLCKAVIAILKKDRSFSKKIWDIISTHKKYNFANKHYTDIILSYLSPEIIQDVIEKQLSDESRKTVLDFDRQAVVLDELFSKKGTLELIKHQIHYIIDRYKQPEFIAILSKEQLYLLHILINLYEGPCLSDTSKLETAIKELKIIYPKICKSAVCQLNVVKIIEAQSHQFHTEWRKIDGEIFDGYISLKNIDLSRVDLTGMDLSGTDLSGANLSDAICYDVKFNHANLNHVNFCGTIITNAVFENCINMDSAKAKTLSVLKEQILQASQPAELAEIKQKNSNGFLALHQNKVTGFFGLNANSKKEFLNAIEQREEHLQQKITEQTEQSSSVNGPKQ